MTYSLSTFTTNNGQRRIYLNGTTRSKIYLVEASDGTGKLTWSSRERDTPPKYARGDHYGKIEKDGEAVRRVCDAFGLELGRAGDFARAWAIASGEPETADEKSDRTPAVYPVPDSLSEKYNGCGQALAAVKNGQIVDLVYLKNVSPIYADDFDDDGGYGLLMTIDSHDPDIQAACESLKASGAVVSGQCSSWEFVADRQIEL